MSGKLAGFLSVQRSSGLMKLPQSVFTELLIIQHPFLILCSANTLWSSALLLPGARRTVLQGLRRSICVLHPVWSHFLQHQHVTKTASSLFLLSLLPIDAWQKTTRLFVCFQKICASRRSFTAPPACSCKSIGKISAIYFSAHYVFLRFLDSVLVSGCWWAYFMHICITSFPKYMFIYVHICAQCRGAASSFYLIKYKKMSMTDWCIWVNVLQSLRVENMSAHAFSGIVVKKGANTLQKRSSAALVFGLCLGWLTSNSVMFTSSQKLLMQTSIYRQKKAICAAFYHFCCGSLLPCDCRENYAKALTLQGPFLGLQTSRRCQKSDFRCIFWHVGQLFVKTVNSDYLWTRWQWSKAPACTVFCLKLYRFLFMNRSHHFWVWCGKKSSGKQKRTANVLMN